MILFLGELIQKGFNLIIPGTVIGMIILIGLLLFKIIELESVSSISEILLDNLTLFFVPIGIAVMRSFSDIKGIWIPLIVILIVSTIVIMVVTGLTVQLMTKYIGSNEKGEG